MTKNLKKGSDCFHCQALFFCMGKAQGNVPKEVCDALWNNFLAKISEKEKEENNV